MRELTNQDIMFIIAGVLNVVGIVGSFVPALPGPPLALAAMILCCVAYPSTIMIVLTVMMALLVVALAITDYLAPGYMAKKAGGSKRAEWGANIGLFIGLFFLPWGIVIGPFVGAFIGQISEYSGEFEWKKSFVVASYTLMSLLVTSFFKFMACLLMLAICIVDVVIYYYNL
ncbi:MAG: DUF456 domain-containing protein [Bacteroidaceae bacterium]|nr:DUF456 domain-containing protein [Bacteroidaceae bacterium]